MTASALFATGTFRTYWYKYWNAGDEIAYPLDVSMYVHNNAGTCEVTYKGVVKIGNNLVKPDSAVISHSGDKFNYPGGNETLVCGLATVVETATFISGNANDLPNANAKARMRVSYTGYPNAYTSTKWKFEKTYTESYYTSESN